MKKITKYLIIYFSLVSIIGQSAVSSEGSTNNFVYVDNDNIDGPWDGTQEHPYQYIQDAIDNSVANDKIFVYEGTYYENVIVNKTIELIGENKASTQIDGGGQNTVVTIIADNVLLRNFTISNSGTEVDINDRFNTDAGIRIISNNVNVSNNLFALNNIGICLNNTNNNTVFRNDFLKTGGSIYNMFSSNNKILKNTFNSTLGGIIQHKTLHTLVHDNTLTNVQLFSIGLWDCCDDNVSYNKVTGSDSYGILLMDSSQNHISYNDVSINDETMRMFESFHMQNSKNNRIIENYIHDSRCNGMIIFSDSNNNTIDGNLLVNNRMDGLVIAYSSGNHVENNEILKTDGDSVYIYGDSTSNTISDNIILGCGTQESGYLRSGIVIVDRSSNTIIRSNDISNHSGGGIGISTCNNTIMNNVIENNSYNGISFQHATDNLISKNVISNNKNGLYLGEMSCKNYILRNTIKENRNYGVYLESLSEENSIFSNNFIGNNENAYFESKGNIWKRNYWERPRILPYRIIGKDEQYDIDWFPRIFPVNIHL